MAPAPHMHRAGGGVGLLVLLPLTHRAEDGARVADCCPHRMGSGTPCVNVLFQEAPLVAGKLQ